MLQNLLINVEITMLKIASVALVALLTTGCSSFHQSQPNASLASSVNANLKANIEVGEQITGKSEVAVILGIFDVGTTGKSADGVSYGSGTGGLTSFGTIETAKSEAAYDAVTKSKADIIVMPRYTIQENGFFLYKTINVTVVGLKGTIKSVVDTR